MKRVTRCLGCNKIKRLNLSYSVKLVDRITAGFTGEVKNVEIVGKICKECAEEAGYVTNRKKSKTMESNPSEVEAQVPEVGDNQL